MTKPRRGRKPLAQEARTLIAARIRQRTVYQQLDKDGQPLEPNQGRYGERKQRRGIPIGIGLYPDGGVGGDMLSIQQLEGEMIATPTEAAIHYGDNLDDIQKADWFQEPESGNQKAREFYELDDSDDDALGDLFEAAGEDAVDDLFR